MKRVRLSSQVRKAFPGRSRGFTLIEVLIALALMGTIAIAVLSALSTASMALITADSHATAESLARSQMEFVKNQDYDPTDPGGEVTYTKIPSIPDGYTIGSFNRDDEIVEDVIGVPWDSGNYTAVYVDAGLQRIKLVIKNSGKVVITLEGYKRNPEA
jgi:prepilin-type N-terminal cleavage/methylation domain-containing protein